jgi:hypothetical protein
MGKGELVVYEGGPTDIAVARPPDVVLEEAHKAAKALMDVMGAKKKKVMMNGEQYLEFEDWQTVGRFYGVTVKVTSTEFIDYGGAKGFLAKASVLRHDGAEISAAEAMCLNDEEKWSTRTKYEWKEVLDANGKMIWEPNPDKPGKSRPKREKVKVGEESVPLFQLRSMAQTRACAKALRNVLAWVVVLAGYRPTPAEEIDGMSSTVDQGSVVDSPPQTPVPAPATAPVVPPGSTISPTVTIRTVQIPLVPPPATGKEPEKDIQTLRYELGELAQIAVDAGIYSNTGDAIQDFTSSEKFQSKCRDAGGMQKDWAIKKAITKANAVLNSIPVRLDNGPDDDIPL